MEELKRKIAEMEANPNRSKMQEAVLVKLKNDLASSVSSGNTHAQTTKSMFFNKEGTTKIENIITSNISPNPYQPRTHFRETEISDLAESIKSNGLIEPIAVTKKDGEVILIAGQKRIKAYELLNKKEEEQGLEPIEMKYFSIPCFLIEIKKETDIAILSIAENTARENPFVLDTARAIKTLFEILKKEDETLSQNKYSEMAKEYFGIKSKGTISKYLQIASIDESVQKELFKKGVDSFTELYALAKSNLSIEEQISLVKNGELPQLNTQKEKEKKEVLQPEEQEKTSVEEFREEEEKEVSIKEETLHEASTAKKSKSKIDIVYLIDTIKNLSATPVEDKPRLEEELLEYLSEFEA